MASGIGYFISTHHIVFLCSALLMCVALSMGLLFWKEEVDNVKLFMPHDSPIRKAAQWVEDNFKNDIRFESIIVEANNVLNPNVLRAISELDKEIRAINVSGHDWKDVCAGYFSWFPNANISEIEEIGVLTEANTEDISHDDCIYQSVLKIWTKNGSLDYVKPFDQRVILKNITHAINNSFRSGKNILDEIKPLLSHIEYEDSMKQVVKGAKATILNWMLKEGTSFSADWELEFTKRVLNYNKTFPSDMKVYTISTRSYLDSLQEVLANNLTVLFAGFSLIIVYVLAMLGKCNAVQHRVYLSLMSVLLVGLAIVCSFGACFYLGFFWGPLHPILPFLFLGLGIDNTFVIVQSLDNTVKQGGVYHVPTKISQALQISGVSVLITSLTDMLAFAVGITTSMPFLNSFCMFASFGILFLYLLELFFLVPCLTMDEYRIQNQRDGFCCQRMKQWKPNDCSQKSFQNIFVEKYISPFLVKSCIKVVILLVTVLIFSICVWCVTKVEQMFDPMWYLNQESHVIKFNEKLNQYFPEYGSRAAIYFGNINYMNHKDQLYKLFNLLKTNRYINNAAVNFWFPAFLSWLNNSYPDETVSDEEGLKGYLFEYLFITSEGQGYLQDLKFSKFPFGDYNITASKIRIQHILMNTTSEQVEAMDSIRRIIEMTNFTNEVVFFSPEYVSWTANKIIGTELLRNLGITVVAVFLVTLFLIQNLITTFWVILCVIFTVVDVVGTMYWFGLTIEISTSIMVLLCAGLAVDYACHIGHEFTRQQGTKNERARVTLNLMGPPVFNGGFSTLLAFVLCGFSDSYLFRTFFKLFSGVVVFGLFHGLVFLPVVLSWFGPASPSSSVIHNTNSRYTVADGCDVVFPSEDIGSSSGNKRKLAPLFTVSKNEENGINLCEKQSSEEYK